MGERWVETVLYYELRDAFQDETVIQHGRPEWMGRQHLDVYLPKGQSRLAQDFCNSVRQPRQRQRSGTQSCIRRSVNLWWDGILFNQQITVTHKILDQMAGCRSFCKGAAICWRSVLKLKKEFVSD